MAVSSARRKLSVSPLTILSTLADLAWRAFTSFLSSLQLRRGAELEKTHAHHCEAACQAAACYWNARASSSVLSKASRPARRWDATTWHTMLTLLGRARRPLWMNRCQGAGSQDCVSGHVSHQVGGGPTYAEQVRMARTQAAQSATTGTATRNQESAGNHLFGFAEAALHTLTRRAPGCSGHPLWQCRCCCRVEGVSLPNGRPSLLMTGQGQRSFGTTMAGSSALSEKTADIRLTSALQPLPSR